MQMPISIKNISSLEAYKLLEMDECTIVVDIRTTEEWQKIGIPKLDKDQVLFLSWRLLPDMSLNCEFNNQFMSKVSNKNNVLFLCRSGARSHEAALCAGGLGYTKCYNIVDGFEGGGNGAGWKQNNLPWQVL
ncbi:MULTISPECIES: rhodanese-like domain-containing protein [unclassified Candidatus Tisiphia]|uniref:rhodanese-like domain-containing protein n=1 Tax=unclassified Candidatus Tisiphia TaxID=2996318 RepID=UPI00313E1D26